MGLLPFVGFAICFFFFRLGLLSHILFRIDVGLWAVGLLCYNYFLLESRTYKFFYLFEGVPDFA